MTSSDTPYAFESLEGCSVISLLPELNDAQWSDIEQVGTDLLERLNSIQSPAFIVDLSSLSYMGSAMVALIVRLWKSVKDRDGKMVVVNRHELVFEVLKLAGLHKVWTIVETREEGFSELGIKASAAPRAAGGGLGGSVAATGGQEGLGLPILGIIAVTGALAGLILGKMQIVGDRVGLAVGVVCAMIGLVIGMISAVQGGGARRSLGFVVIVASFAVVIVAILTMPAGGTPAKAPAAQTPPSTPAATPAAAQPQEAAPANAQPAGESSAPPAAGEKEEDEDTAMRLKSPRRSTTTDGFVDSQPIPNVQAFEIAI